MRVTNEQAKAMANCCGTSCSVCVINGDICDGVHREELAADLLEARELIKEMREALLRVQKIQKLDYGHATDLHIDMLDFPRRYSDLFDKTKEYAK